VGFVVKYLWILTQSVFVFLYSLTCTASSCTDFAESGCRIKIEANKSFVKLTDKKVTSISIANPDIADVKLVTPRQVLILAKKIGATNLILWYGDSDDSHADIYEVAVYISNNQIKYIQSQIEYYTPGAKIEVKQGNGGVILSGIVESQQELDRILTVVSAHVYKITNLIVLRSLQQVQLEVTIAEVSRTGMKKMGLGFLINQANGIGIFNNGSAHASSSRTNTGTRSASISSSITAPFASAFQIALSNEKANIGAILSILKGQALSRLLATPTLVTSSGQAARFIVGGEFPVPVAGDSGSVAIQFKEVGVKLEFTPTIIGKEVISLVVEPEISSLDYTVAVKSGGVYVPGVKTRKGLATLTLRDGQTFAMAGLLKEESSKNINKIPFLGDLPILGGLFTSKEFSKDETELVVMVTPRLVKPLNREDIPELPGETLHDNMNDIDFFVLNRLKYKKSKSEKIKTEKNNKPGNIVSLPSSPVFMGDIGFSR